MDKDYPSLVDALLGRGGGIRNRLVGDDLETGLNAHDADLRQRNADVAATQGPLFKDWLTNSLMYGLMALPGRSVRGAKIGDANVWAGRASRIPEQPGPSSYQLFRDHNNGALLEGLPGENSGFGNEMYLPTRLDQRASNLNESQKPTLANALSRMTELDTLLTKELGPAPPHRALTPSEQATFEQVQQRGKGKQLGPGQEWNPEVPPHIRDLMTRDTMEFEARAIDGYRRGAQEVSAPEIQADIREFRQRLQELAKGSPINRSGELTDSGANTLEMQGIQMRLDIALEALRQKLIPGGKKD